MTVRVHVERSLGPFVSQKPSICVVGNYCVFRS